MKYIKLLIVLMAMSLCSAAFAQNITVTGVVTDSSTGQGVPFASLQIKGTMTGASTDGDGLYSIEAPASGVIIFSSIGYKDVEVAIAGKTRHDVALHPDTETIEETIVWPSVQRQKNPLPDLQPSSNPLTSRRHSLQMQPGHLKVLWPVYR